MIIQRVFKETPEIRRLWEDNMQEKWDEYDKATKFIQKNASGEIIGGFAIYHDNSDGVVGNFISGWSIRKNLESVEAVIQTAADAMGEIFIKTQKREMKWVAGRMGEVVQICGSFAYYKVKGNRHGKT